MSEAFDKTLRKQVIEENIVRETYDEFVTRVRETMLNFSIPKIDRIIESMDKRITLIMESKGCRMKYQVNSDFFSICSQ